MTVSRGHPLLQFIVLLKHLMTTVDYLKIILTGILSVDTGKSIIRRGVKKGFSIIDD